jgi:hypothetical protein
VGLLLLLQSLEIVLDGTTLEGVIEVLESSEYSFIESTRHELWLRYLCVGAFLLF